MRLCYPSEQGTVHPTEKVPGLFEYLLRTCKNPGDLVLNDTMGSGTTVMAALQCGRRAIGIEMDQAYFEIARRRSESAQMPTRA